MAKTYSFPTESKSRNAERSWEQRWTKKFGTFSKPITVPASMIQAGIVDLPPEPGPNLSDWLPASSTFAPQSKDEQLKGLTLRPVQKLAWDEAKASELLIDWKSAMDAVTKNYTTQLTVDAPAMDSWYKGVARGAAARALTVPLEPRKLDREGTTISTGYLSTIYEPEAYPRTVDLIVEMMRPHLDEIDAIAFRGSSGAALAYPLAYILRKPLVHVRKEMGHAFSKTEGIMGAKRIAIVDDFVASGSTLRTIMEELVAGYAERGYAAPVLTHLFLYAERCSSSEGAVRGAVGEILEGCEIHLAYDR